jgi:hypothetical protein
MTIADLIGDNTLKDPVRYCIETILKEARQEDRLVRQILYAMLSAYTNNPINLAINSPTGEGKSYVLTKVAEMFPEGDVIFLSHMTEKALFHRRGNYVKRDESGKYVSIDQMTSEIDSEILDKESEVQRTNNKDLKKGLNWTIQELKNEKKGLYTESKKVIDLSHKILIFLDTPPMGLFNAIMPLLSHDKYEVEYEYTDTHEGIRTRSNVIRGWPSVIFAAAVDYSHHDRWPEIQRRFIITNPKMTQEKYDDAVSYMSEKFGVPDFVYQKTNVSDEEKDEVRSIIRMIREEILEISKRFDNGKNNVIISVDPALFPHKEYIISQIHRVLEYSAEEDKRPTILDHKGKEITVEELVNRYYDNPTDYFDSGDNKPINPCEINNDECES